MEKDLVHMKVNGWCILEGVIPRDDVAAVRRSVEETIARHGRSDGPENLGHLRSIINYDQSFAPCLADARLLGIASALLGRHVRISFTTAMVNNPGVKRGGWHADWPFNQKNAGHIPAPYPDAVMHLTTLWMLSDFTGENGGTFVLPGSHRSDNNPTGNNGVDPEASLPGEFQVTGNAGSIMVFDSRLWHVIAPNRSDRPRVGMAIRYAPWWLNLDVLLHGSDERARMVDEPGEKENLNFPVSQEVFRSLPDNVKPLYRHLCGKEGLR